MKIFFKQLIFTMSFLFAFAIAEGRETHLNFLDSLDLTGFNEEQKIIIKKETQNYFKTIEPLYESNNQAWREKIQEFFVKLRDGFRIYRIARNPELERKIIEFDSTAKTKVYILTHIDDAFLNNLFLRLAEAYYQSTKPYKYIIVKYKYKKASGYTINSPIFSPDKTDIEVAPIIEKKLSKKIEELTTIVDARVKMDMGSGCTMTDAQCAAAINGSVDELIRWFIENGIKDIKEINYTHPLVTFIDPAGNAFSILNNIVIVSAVQNGPLISFKDQYGNLFENVCRSGKFYGYVFKDGKSYEYPEGQTMLPNVWGFWIIKKTTDSKPLACFVKADYIEEEKSLKLEDLLYAKVVEDPLSLRSERLPAFFNNPPACAVNNQVILKFEGNGIKEEKIKIADVEVTKLIFYKEEVQLAKSLNDLEKKYDAIKNSPERTKVSFYENGFMVTLDGGKKTSKAISEAEFLRKIQEINEGKITSKSETLFSTRQTPDGRTIYEVAAHGYNKNLKAVTNDPKKLAAAMNRQQIEEVQQKQLEKMNDYLLKKNITDLTTKNPKQESGEFPDKRKTVIKEMDVWDTFASIGKETVSFIENVEVPRRMYDNTLGDEYNKCIVNTSPLLSGGANGVIEEVLGLPRIIILATDIVLDENVRNGIVDQFSNLTPAKIKDAIVNGANDAADHLTGDSPIDWHWKGKTTVSIVFTVLGTGLVKDIDDAVDNFGTINKNLDELSGPLGGILKKLKKKLDELPEEDLKLFKADLADPDFVKYIDEAPDPDALVDAWKILKEGSYRNKIGALEFFSNPSVLSSRQKIFNEGINKLYPNIPVEELTAIRHYTTDAYADLNLALRNGNPNEFYKSFEEMTNNGLSKLQKFKGDKVYRGVHGEEAVLAKTLKEGDDINFKDFKSTTTSKTVANDFSGSVIYEITNPKGYNICGISCLPGESEVLFKSNSRFKVKEVISDYVLSDSDHNPHITKKIILEFIEE